jgi:AsmA protein
MMSGQFPWIGRPARDVLSEFQGFQKTLEPKSRRFTMAKRILITIGVIVLLLIVVALALPLFIDANRFKPTLESDLSSALGRKVDIGNISLSILSGSVSVDSVSIADDAAFSPAPFLSAKQLSAGVSLMPLIFSKRLHVSSFTVTDPQVTLLRAPSGRWNYSSLGATSSPAPATGKPAESKAPESTTGSAQATNFSVAELKISNGTITVGTVGTAKRRTYQGVNLEASDLSYTAQFPFQLTAKTPGGGSIKIEGKAGPVNQSDASLTPFNGTIGVGGLDLAATGFVDPSSGIGGMVDFQGDVGSDGREMTSKGTLKATKITLVPHSSPATVPVNLDYTTTYDLAHNTGTLSQGEIHVGKASATLGGTYNAAGATTTVQMKLEGKTMPVTDLEGVLPAVGVTLPSGASLETGSLDATLAINGPVDKLVITGPVNLSNAKLAGFNLRGKLGALGSFTGLGGGGGSSDTEIQTLSANVHVDPQGTQAQNLDLVVPSIGTITGNGNVSSTGQLDCKMVAKLGSAAGAVTSALSSLTGGSSGGGIPFKITGTTSAPVFLPDLGGMTKGLAGQNNPASQASGVLGGLLKKKPKQ